MHKLLYTGGFMKKKYLTHAGIISAGILIFMFIGIFFLGHVLFLKDSSLSPSLASDYNRSMNQANSTTNAMLPGNASYYGSCLKSTRFITIDTIPNLRMNQSYNISGTTDLPAGEDLFIQVLPLEYNIDVNAKSQSMTGNLSGAVGIVSIKKGTGNSNLWSFEIQTNMLPPTGGYYLVNVSNDRFDQRSSAIVSGDAFCAERFALKG